MGKRGKVETELDLFERICRRTMHLTTSDWKQYVELPHLPQDRHSLVDGILMLQAGMV